uniref:Serpin domain-containing protein n=1 Tax=Otolemur garnettii TaxID=30611 RepID=H0XHX7_OTOGA
MARPILPLLLLVAGLGHHACGQRAFETPIRGTLSASSTSLNNSHLAFSLYRQLVAPDPETNVLFSPLSFSLPLTLLALYAKPEASAKILQGLGIPLAKVSPERAHVYYSQQLRSLLPSPDGCQIDMDSVLFVDKTWKMLQKFIETAQTLYRTDVFYTSFKNEDFAKYEMDFFMKKKSNGKVGNIVQAFGLDTALILANYILFKGKWKHGFNPELTEKRPFSVNNKITIQVPMMQGLGRFQVQRFVHLHSTVLRMPYMCNSTAIFILPDKGKVREAEEAVMKESFDTWTQSYPLRKKRLYFPKFFLSSNIQLDKFLPTVGISDMFSYHAGLSGFSLDIRPIKLAYAEQSAELTVQEEGTAGDPNDLQFLDKDYLPALHFNRPFLMLVFEDSSRSLFFVGKVVTPKEI